MTMTYSGNAMQLLTEPCEGVSLRVYKDPMGILTVGCGHRVLPTDNLAVGDAISFGRMEQLLTADIAWAARAVNTLCTVALTQHQFDALTDFCFNCGAGNFRDSSLLRLVNAQDFAAADEEFGKWVRSCGEVLPGLVRRRQAEARWFMTEG